MSSTVEMVEPLIDRLKRSSPVAIALYAVSFIGFLLAQVVSTQTLDNIALNFPTFGSHIWTLCTFWVVEPNIIVLFGNVLCIHLGNTVLEPLWRRWELGRLAIIANVATIVGTFVTFYTVAITVGVDAFGAGGGQWRLCGLSAFNAAVFVGVKQILPDSVLLTTSVGRLKNNNIPLCMFLSSILLALFGLARYTVPFMYTLGAFSAWLYLRFYQKHENGVKGDMEDHFAFHTFFPTALHRPLARIGRVVFTLATRVGLCAPTVRRFVDVQQLHAHGGQLLNASMNQDAERRRAKAMKELTERMERSKAMALEQATQQWPSMDVEVESTPTATQHTPTTVDSSVSSSTTPSTTTPSTTTDAVLVDVTAETVYETK